MTSIEELTKQAEAAFIINDYDKAKDLCRQGIKILEKSDDKVSVMSTIKFLTILSDSDNMQGKLFDSILSLERIIEMADGQRDLNTKADAMIKMGSHFSKSGKWEKAIAIFEEAESIVKTFKNPYLLGLTLGGLGEVYFRTGKVMDAIATGQKMMDIGEKIDNQHLIGMATNIIMISWHGMGKFELALEVNSKTIEAYRKLNDNSKLGMAYNNRGEIYKALGDYENALDSYKKGLEVDKNIFVNNLAYVYPNIAECHVRLGQTSKAKEAIKKAETKMKNSEDKYAVAYLWMIKGMVEYKDGNQDAALEWLSKAEKRMVSLNIPYDAGVITLEHAITLINCGDKYQGQMKLEKALAYFKEAGSKHMLDITQKHIEKCSKQ